MLNCTTMSKAYRWRIEMKTDFLLDKMIDDYLQKRGGDIREKEITAMFCTALETARLLVDLEIGSGLDPLEEEKNDDSTDKTPVDTYIEDAVRDLGAGDSEGPTGSFGNEGRVRDPASEPDSADDNGTTGFREVDATKFQRTPPKSRSGAGRGHGGGPEGSAVHPASGD